MTAQYKFYGVQSCGYCAKQKELLGGNVVDLSYIDCNENKVSCSELEITVYPTGFAFYKGTDKLTRTTGLQLIEDILEMIGCFVE